jgi:purine-nucleoside phosphorylase
MSEAYDEELIGLCHQIAGENNIRLFNSVYAGLQGPNLETKSEYDYLHRIGATVVGMSTVPEVIVARHMNMRVCVLTAVTNKCFPVDIIAEVSHDKVIEVAARAGHHMSIIFEELIEKISSD